MKFRSVKRGNVFFCSGSEYIKVSGKGAIRISPLIVAFAPDEQVMPSMKSSTTIGNWKWSDKSKIGDVP